MKIYCDGGSRGNPGPAAAAIIVYDDNNQIAASRSRYLGVATNNDAEYASLIMALEWVAKSVPAKAEIVMDSELVVKQMCGVYKIKNERLRKLSLQANSIIKNAPTNISIVHTKRGGNPEADRLVNKTLDKYTN